MATASEPVYEEDVCLSSEREHEVLSMTIDEFNLWLETDEANPLTQQYREHLHMRVILAQISIDE